MEKEFKKVLTLLMKLSKNLSPKKYYFASVQLETRRMKDLVLLDKKTINHLDLLKNSSSIDGIMAQICRLHVCLNTYVWHIDSMKELVEKFLKENKNND